MNRIKKVLISEEQIKTKVAELGERLTRDYQGKNPVFLCVCKGSFVFTADLIRAFEDHCEIDFIFVSSYGASTHSSGKVRLLKDLTVDISGRDVIVVEDILDTGITLQFILELIKEKHPNSVKVCTFLDKPERRVSNIFADYVGYEIPNEFVIGYGLDLAEKYRNLPYIGIYDEEGSV